MSIGGQLMHPAVVCVDGAREWTMMGESVYVDRLYTPMTSLR